MNPFSIFNVLWTAISLWSKYGSTAEKAMTIFHDLDALDNGQFFNNINVVLIKNGVDLEKLLAEIATNTATNVANIPAPAAPPVDTPVAPIDNPSWHTGR